MVAAASAGRGALWWRNRAALRRGPRSRSLGSPSKRDEHSRGRNQDEDLRTEGDGSV